MNIRHSSTGKKIVQNNFYQVAGKETGGDINFEALVQKPDSNHAEGLALIRDRLKQTSGLVFPEEPKFLFNKSRDTFRSVFPYRNSSVHSRRSSYLAQNEVDLPVKHYNHRTDGVTLHRDAMIRASNLFKVFITK